MNTGCTGDPSDVATIEYDFGDGANSYNAQPTHTYVEAGRMFSGFVSIVDRRGQAVVQVRSLCLGLWRLALSNLRAWDACMGHACWLGAHIQQ